MRILGLKCKRCGHVFPSGIVPGAFGRPVLARTVWPCPACHVPDLYGSDDFVLPA